MGATPRTIQLLRMQRPFYTGVVQPSRRHSPFAPCLPHNPLAIVIVVQPSTKHGLPPRFLQVKNIPTLPATLYTASTLLRECTRVTLAGTVAPSVVTTSSPTAATPLRVGLDQCRDNRCNINYNECRVSAHCRQDGGGSFVQRSSSRMVPGM